MSSIAKKFPKRLEFVIVGVVGEESWSEIHPCFAQSELLSNRMAIIEEPYVTYMPKIITTNSSIETSSKIKDTEHAWKCESSNVNWPTIKHKFFEDNKIILPAPQSRSSDLYIYLPPEEIDKAAFTTQGNEITEIVLFVFCIGIQNSIINEYCNSNGNRFR